MMRHAAAPTAAVLATTLTASAETARIDFALDRKFEGPSAPFFLAIDKGYFADAGLELTVTAGQGSLDAIPKVATAACPIGFAVMMTCDTPPFAVVGRKSLGVDPKGPGRQGSCRPASG